MVDIGVVIALARRIAAQFTGVGVQSFGTATVSGSNYIIPVTLTDSTVVNLTIPIPNNLANLTAGMIPRFDGTNLVNSSLEELNDMVESRKALGTTANEVQFNALVMGSAGEAFSLEDSANNRRGYLIGYERLTDGTGRPFWRKLGALQTGVSIQPLKDTNTGSQNATVDITFTANRLVTSLTIESTETVTNATISLLRNSVVVETMTGLDFTADTEKTIQLPRGLICTSGSTYNVQIEGVILKGTGTIGTDFQLFLEIDNHIWTSQNLIDDSMITDIGRGQVITTTEATKLNGIETGAQVNRTDEETFNLVKTFFVNGTNTTVVINDANNEIRINASGTGGTTPTPITNDLRYGLSSASDPALVDFTSLTDEANPTDPITIATGTTTAGQYFHIFSANTHDIQTITDTVLSQIVYQDGATGNIFAKISDARTENSITYDAYSIGPLNAGVDEQYVLNFS